MVTGHLPAGLRPQGRASRRVPPIDRENPMRVVLATHSTSQPVRTAAMPTAADTCEIADSGCRAEA